MLHRQQLAPLPLSLNCQPKKSLCGKTPTSSRPSHALTSSPSTWLFFDFYCSHFIRQIKAIKYTTSYVASLQFRKRYSVYGRVRKLLHEEGGRNIHKMRLRYRERYFFAALSGLIY
jgi:hypothetical protein